MMVLKILGLLITAAAGARINVSNLPDRGVPQSVLNENLFNVYPHLVYVAPGSGVVVSRVGNVRNTVNYGRKMFEEQASSSLPQIANEQFLKEVTPTTQTVLEKQQLPFMRAIISSNIEGKRRDQYQYAVDPQVEEHDDSTEQGHNVNGPNPDFRVLFVQGNEPSAENNHYHQRLVDNVKPKSIFGASHSLRKTHLRKQLPTKPQAIDYDYQEERSAETPPHANHFVQFPQPDNSNEQIGLRHFQSSSNPQSIDPHRLQNEMSEEELYSFYIKQLQEKLAHFVPKKTNVPESKTLNRHKQLPVIFKTRNEQPYEENAAPIRRSSPISREFHYESLPYNHFIKKERAVQILQDEEE